MMEEIPDSPPNVGADLASVAMRLVEARRGLFSLDTFIEITGLLPQAARQKLGELLRLGVVSRVRRDIAKDTFLLVPQRIGVDPARLDPPYELAPMLAGERDYYVSHGSAMELHRMGGPIRPALYVMRPVYTHNRSVAGTLFFFVKCLPGGFFGAMALQLGARTSVMVSDLERTLIDGLRQPKYCGGFPKVVLGLQLRRRDVDIDKLLRYAIALDYGNLLRRLGYLLDLCRIDAPAALSQLQDRIDPAAAYTPLDGMRQRRGICCPRWRLHVNFDLADIEAAAGLSHIEHLDILR